MKHTSKTVLILSIAVFLIQPVFGMYHQKMGRFMTQDPLGIISDKYAGRLRPIIQYLNGLSIYGYVSANPVMYNDPLGLFDVRECVGYICYVNPIDLRRAQSCKTRAFDFSNSYGGNSGDRNALRHCFYSACLHRNLDSENAEQMLLIHEVGYVGSCDSNIDMRNNEQGCQIGEGTGSIANQCMGAMVTGDLVRNEEQGTGLGLCPGEDCDPTDDTSGSDDSSNSDSGKSDSYDWVLW